MRISPNFFANTKCTEILGMFIIQLLHGEIRICRSKEMCEVLKSDINFPARVKSQKLGGGFL